MNTCRIELVYFDGCPNAAQARETLRSIPCVGSWTEWNLSSPDTPDRFRRYGSPTVLVDGRDVTGDAAPDDAGDAMSCRTDGAPSAEQVRRALEGRFG